MEIKFDAQSSRHPTVNWVDANKRGDAVDLIFGMGIEGQGALSELRSRLANGKISNFS